MPAKSILETRIRERLDEARSHEAALVRTLDALEVQMKDYKQGLYRAQSEVVMLENLLAPEGGTAGCPRGEPGPGEDGLPGEDASDE